MDIDGERLRVRQGDVIDLATAPTRIEAVYNAEAGFKQQLKARVDRIRDEQERIFAHNRYALLLVFQAMDAAGKDGVIRSVMSGVNPAGCQVSTFKRPSAVELEHNFLWRPTPFLPPRGIIGIFNRSYYEEVLIAKVEPEVLAAQNLPHEIANDPDIWAKRYQSIRDFERHLHQNGTRVVKFFLHISPEEQRQRLLSRIDDPAKNWKFDDKDLIARARWDDYMQAYSECLRETSSDESPWYLIPADDKKNARLYVAQVVADTLNDLDLGWPELTPEHRQELLEARKKLID